MKTQNLLLLIILLSISVVTAQQTELEVNPYFSTYGPSSHHPQYGVVGDAFGYNIYFDNNNSKDLCMDFIIEVYDPKDILISTDEYNNFFIGKFNSSSIYSKKNLQFKFPGGL